MYAIKHTTTGEYFTGRFLAVIVMKFMTEYKASFQKDSPYIACFKTEEKAKNFILTMQGHRWVDFPISELEAVEV